MFWIKTKKNKYTPVTPVVLYKSGGIMGYTFQAGHVIPMQLIISKLSLNHINLT